MSGLYGREGDHPPRTAQRWEDIFTQWPPGRTQFRLCSDQRCANRYHYGPCTWRANERYL